MRLANEGDIQEQERPSITPFKLCLHILSQEAINLQKQFKHEAQKQKRKTNAGLGLGYGIFGI